MPFCMSLCVCVYLFYAYCVVCVLLIVPPGYSLG
jgi:hypothetical protein